MADKVAATTMSKKAGKSLKEKRANAEVVKNKIEIVPPGKRH